MRASTVDWSAGRIGLILIGGLGLAALAGCTHVITQTTPYYEDGPNQLDPPQGELEKDTWVWVVGREGSYVHVWAANFVDAYVRDWAVEPLLKWDGWKKKKEQDQRPAVIELGP